MSEQTNPIPVNDPSEIPENLSDEEELEFWDTHYMTEAYLSKMEEAPEEERPQARSYSKQVNVRMDESNVERLKDLAEARGVGYQTLMKDFIKERLYEEEIREGTVSRANSPARKTVFNVPAFPRAFPSPPTFKRIKLLGVRSNPLVRTGGALDPRDINKFSEPIRRILANSALNPNTQAIQAAQRSLARYQRLPVQSFLQNLRTPTVQNAFSNLSIPSSNLTETQNVQLPIANFHPSVNLNKEAAETISRAVRNNLNFTNQVSEQVQGPIQSAFSSLRQNVDPTALASANFAALNHIRPSLNAVVSDMSRLPTQEILSQYQEALANASRLLRDENIQQLLRSATSQDLVKEGIESAAEMEDSAEDLSFSFDFQTLDLSQFLSLDNLQINLAKLFAILSVASIMASHDVALTHYEQGINETLKYIGAVEAVLYVARESRGDGED